MLKVLQHVKAFHTTHGGVERVVEELVPGLNRYPDLEVDVLCQGPEHRDYALPGRGRVIQAKTNLEIAAASLSWGDFGAWRRAGDRYDIVHVHLPWPQSNLNQFFGRFDGAVVLHWHSDIVRQRLLYSGFRWLERWLLRRADRICVTSPKLLAESCALEGFRDKAISTPIGIAESAHVVESAEIETLRHRYDGRAIVFALGRLVPYKGFEYLVRAASSLGKDSVILIGGDGPLARELERLIHELGVTDRAVLLGPLSDRDVELHMRACSVFCLPSVQKSEAFGIVQVEAMRAGRPVVSTRIFGSGIDWVNEDGVTGFTVQPGDATALAHALAQITRDRALARRLGECARRRYEELFTARRMAETTRETYLALRL